MGKRYSSDELAVLQDSYKDNNNDELATILGRSSQSVFI
jgi:hypothetical protein